jgi:hypothetical protein
MSSLQTINEHEDGGFVGNPFTGVLHIQPTCEESSGGLVFCSPTSLEVTYIVRSLVGTLEVFSERSLHVKPGLDGIFRQVNDPLPRCAEKHQGQIADSNIG